MGTPHDLIAAASAAALGDLTQDADLDVAATVQPSRNPEHGDYQCNAALRLAKPLKRKPLEIAEELAAKIEPGPVFEPPEVAPPGFVNFRLTDAWLAEELGERAGLGRIELGPAAQKEHVVVDFSSPNVAKEMHVEIGRASCRERV